MSKLIGHNVRFEIDNGDGVFRPVPPISSGGHLVPDFMVADLRLVEMSAAHGWDRRRLKRELRKGAKSTYSKVQK